MPKYKVGDRVRIVRIAPFVFGLAHTVGMESTIIRVDKHPRFGPEYTLFCYPHIFFKEDELELVEEAGE